MQRARSELPAQLLESPRCGTSSGVSSSGFPAEQVSRRKLPGRSFSAQPERPRSSGRVDGSRRGAESTSPGLISPLDLRRQAGAERAEHSSGAARAAQAEAGRVGDLRRNVLEKSLSDRPERPLTAAGRCGSGGRRLSSGLGRQTVGDERGTKGKEGGVWAVCDRLIAENDKSTTPREGGAGSPRGNAGEQRRTGLKEMRGGDTREHCAHGECCKAQEMLARQVDGLTRQVEELTHTNAQLREMLQVRSGEVQRAEEALKVAQGERDALAQEMEAALHTWMAPTPRAATPRTDVTNASVTIEEHAAVVGQVAAVERENRELWAMLEGLSAQREAELRQTEGLRMRVKCMAAASGSPASTGKNGGGSPEAMRTLLRLPQYSSSAPMLQAILSTMSEARASSSGFNLSVTPVTLLVPINPNQLCRSLKGFKARSLLRLLAFHVVKGLYTQERLTALPRGAKMRTFFHRHSIRKVNGPLLPDAALLSGYPPLWKRLGGIFQRKKKPGKLWERVLPVQVLQFDVYTTPFFTVHVVQAAPYLQILINTVNTVNATVNAPYTLLVPLEALDYCTTIKKYPSQQLLPLMAYHIVKGRFTYSVMNGLKNGTTLSTISGRSLTRITKKFVPLVMVTGQANDVAIVLAGDVYSTKTVTVHIISKMLQPWST
ncbi:unnamed protein product [Closterium sp. Naga37s-1]|nr:unnamed protein product [Closterium sp. Naga37s-1]